MRLFFLNLFFLLFFFGCEIKQSSFSDTNINIYTRNGILKFKLPLIRDITLTHEYSDYNDELRDIYKYSFLNKSDTGKMEIISLTKGEVLSTNNEQIIYPWGENRLRLLDKSLNSFRRKTMMLNKTKFYIIYFKSGCFIQNYESGNSLSIYIHEIKDSLFTNAFVSTLMFKKM